MIIGTAGHIDHGKSSLVAALTGRSMDRLAEERRRGITIELGFAPLVLDGIEAGVVDVPGHEDFVRTMVAGASGVDLALLVIAADDGMMPQTLEHLAILEHLGVPRGVPVLAKADLVDRDWLELVAADVGERLARSRVAFEAPLPVSVVTGAGLAALRSRLSAIARETPARGAPGDAFRLPIDRAFSLAGVGTVVTGTAWSGTLAVGDSVRVLPGGAEGRVRTLETHGRAEMRSTPGARLAVGIAGLERSAARRGQVLVTAELPWAESSVLDVELELHADAPRALGPRTRLRVHLGTAELLARVYPTGPLAPGGRAVVRLALEQPVVARGGDRLVVRSYSPVTTIGGGRVLDPLPPAGPGRAAGHSHRTAALADADPVVSAGALVARRRWGVGPGELPILLGLPPAAAARAAAAASELRAVGDRWIAAAALEAARGEALRMVGAHHARRPSEPGLPLETLRSALRRPAWLVESVVAGLGAEGALTIEGGSARLPGFHAAVAGGDAVLDALAARLEGAGLAPPSVAELEAELGRGDVLAALRLASEGGRLVQVERDRWYARVSLERFTAVLREVGGNGEITPAALRDRLGITRKFLIPLLEWSDRQGLTRRVGEVRVLA